MSKLSKVLFVIWMVLAIACFIGAFYVTPAFVRVIGVLFGIVNLMIIMSWGLATIQAIIEKNKEK